MNVGQFEALMVLLGLSIVMYIGVLITFRNPKKRDKHRGS